MNKTHRTITLAARRHHRQRGMSMIALFVVLTVVAFLGLFAFKVVPQYIEFWTVRAVATDVANNTELMQKPRSKVHEYINQAYRTNNLWDLKADGTIVLKKDKRRGYLVTVDYEKRANLFHNIDVVTRFDYQASAQ